MLRLKMSPRVFQSDLIGIPLVAVLIMMMVLGPSALLAIPGALTWMLAEYCVHRWMFHGFIRIGRSGHTAHHRDQEDFIGASPVISLGIGLMLVALSYLVPTLIPAVLGFIGAYFWYFMLHSGLNHGVLIPGTIANHRLHHSLWGKNFGVTTSVFDRLLGTYHNPKT